MKGTLNQLIRALKPLGEIKQNYNGLKVNCPVCEKAGSSLNKFNLEVSYSKGIFHCWACHYKGSLWKLIKERGYKEYLDLFKLDIDQETTSLTITTFELPQYIINISNNKEAFNYLIERGLTFNKIKERGIKYCYAGDMKEGIIFPSYNLEGELTSYVIHYFKRGKYSVRKKDNHIGFYDSFVDKRSPIILVEGIYDALVVPNAIPMLGTTISDTLLTFLTNTDIIYIPDSDVKQRRVIKSMIIRLNTVCKSISYVKILSLYKDVNDIYVKNKVILTNSLKQYYQNEKA
jgi:DNA primase